MSPSSNGRSYNTFPAEPRQSTEALLPAMNKIFSRPAATLAPVVAEDQPKSPQVVDKASDGEAGPDGRSPTQDATAEDDQDAIDKTAQRGVQKIEATTKVWSRNHLILAYVLIWIINFVDALEQGMSGSLVAYVTSSFAQHSLTATTSVMSSIIGGLFKLPLAKVLDIWGRPHGFVLCMVLLTIGLVMMAACNNVETYAAAQVFYWVGYNGLSYSLSIFVADTSALKNRALLFAFMSSPYIVTVWTSGPIAQSFLDTVGWRWAFGTFAIVTPVMCAPLLGLFAWNYRKAKAMGLIMPEDSGRSAWESVKHYVVQFDLLGILLLAGGLALFLLPFSLYTVVEGQWASATVICMLVFGVLLMVAFALYEKLLAPVTFIPFELLTDRSILGASVLSAVLFISFYIWDSYFPSFLQVVNGLDVTRSSYVVNIYSIGSCFWAIVVGFLIRWTGRFKWLAVYFGMPLTMVGVGLMLAFRQPDVNIGYIVMCQIFIAVAGGTLVICIEMAGMAAVTHQHIAVVLALMSMFSSIGGAIGSTVAAAIWTGVFPARLAEYLPAEEQGNLTEIYSDLTKQLSYPWGSPTRQAIQHAYGDAQRLMLIASTVILVLGFACCIVWRDYRVKDFKQVKGRVI
ncbi:hypothetical protein MAPG_09410 [Magnaporthiopsis poae ATCC 64411]|uniref:Major facilitator superfamily (MFS) profile domain-containing protein n=1 Tax=Magnaporthiopsis poae (strain ATCC 64411 / 73-15) TaxID=644358 RepID=A0A0C4E9W0_MAGP6|nr:hypothetical protein MAPG_09410 [Magnaporthiopsis poae ATCC 64411]